jgi:beta-lactamase regulating signal transducer with metallopeptidase domain
MVVAIALGLPRLGPALERLAPGRRARVLTALCLAPLGTGLALALACLLPSLYAAVWPGLDHCTRHADEHLHLCLVHPPSAVVGTAAVLVGATCLLFVLLRAAPGVVDLLRARRVLARLREVSAETVLAGVRSVDSDAPFSFTGGLLAPDIYLSRGLRERLEAPQLAAVLAHERAHVQRRDVLRRHVAQLGALLHAPGTARSLVSALDLACEEACDAEAAAIIGDRARVAEAIVAVARLGPRPPPALAASVVGFTADALTHRVNALLSTPPPESKAPWWTLAGGFLALVVLAPALHHATETVLSFLAHP